MRIQKQTDFFSGLMFIAVGIGFSVVARGYTMGTAARMGPGYFPFWLGVLLSLLGVIVALGALSPRGEADRIARFDLRTVLWVLGSVVLFALVLKPLGMVLSVVVLVLVSSMASHEFTWRGAILNTLVILAISVTAFVYGINLQMPVWPAFLSS